jgi:hypothetical protein
MDGSIRYACSGVHPLKGVLGDWQLYGVSA